MNAISYSIHHTAAAAADDDDDDYGDYERVALQRSWLQYIQRRLTGKDFQVQ